jgi:hypothetical protein
LEILVGLCRQFFGETVCKRNIPHNSKRVQVSPQLEICTLFVAKGKEMQDRQEVLQARFYSMGRRIQIVEEFFIDQLSRIATYLGPLAPAFLVYHASLQYLVNNDKLQAGILAAVIELLGLSVVSNWLNVREFNRRYKQSLGTTGPIAMVIFYVITVGAMVFGLKIDPEMFGWVALASMSALSLMSALAFVMRRQHSELVRAMEKELRFAETQQEALQASVLTSMDYEAALAAAAQEARLQAVRDEAELVRNARISEQMRMDREKEREDALRQAQHEARVARMKGPIPIEGSAPVMMRVESVVPDVRYSGKEKEKDARIRWIQGKQDHHPEELVVRFGYDNRTARRDLSEAGYVKNGDGRYHQGTKAN